MFDKPFIIYGVLFDHLYVKVSVSNPARNNPFPGHVTHCLRHPLQIRTQYLRLRSLTIRITIKKKREWYVEESLCIII